MLMGAGKEKIKIKKELLPIEKFNSVHDDLFVRTLILNYKTDIPFIIISFEVTSLPPYAIEKFRMLASEITKVSVENIWICVTHTFSAPHLRSQEALNREGHDIVKKNDILLNSMSDAMQSSLNKAISNIEEVNVLHGDTTCSVNVNRDIKTSKGWWIGSNEQGISNKKVSFIKFNTLNNTPKAVLYNYDVQSSIMDHSADNNGYSQITSDLAGSSSQFIENQYNNDFVALFLMGAAGDQAPIFKARQNILTSNKEIKEIDVGELGFVFVDALGKKLGSEVINATENTNNISNIDSKNINLETICISCTGQKIAKSIKDIKPSLTYEFIEEGIRYINAYIITMDDIAFVGLSPEISSKTGMDIKKESPYSLTIVSTMVNGAEKYMPDKTAYERITYEAMNSKFACDSAELIAKNIIDKLNEMKRS